MKLTRRVFIELAGSSALMASAPSLLAQGVTVKDCRCLAARLRADGSDLPAKDALSTVQLKFLIRTEEPPASGVTNILRAITVSAAPEVI